MEPLVGDMQLPAGQGRRRRGVGSSTIPGPDISYSLSGTIDIASAQPTPSGSTVG